MMRRSRISVRPNVRPGSRAPNSSQDGPSAKAAADATQASTEEAVQPHNTETTQTGDQPAEVAQGPESVSPVAKEKGQSVQNSGGGDAPTSVLQRRKRFSATPNLAKPRLTPSTTRVPARLPKSPPRKAATLPLAETLTPPSEDSTTSQSLRSPRWRRASGGVKSPKTQGKPAPLSPTVPASGPAAQGKKEKEKPILPQSTKPSDPGKSSQEETPVPDPSPSCLIPSQGSKSEVKAPSTLAPAPPKLCSDRERIAKALKLRELLKEELRKQRKRKRTRSHVCEHSIPQDHNKMTMRDLIYYLPESNPMKSFPVEESRPAEKVSPASASKELPEKPRESQVQAEEREGEQDDEDEEAAQEDQLVVPRVKVAEDGTLILDEESLTVEVLRTKGPNLAEENDPIFERGSSTTYSSFRKAVYTKPWSNKETEMFFLAISMVGTDFSMIGQLFPHRARSEIKNKFKKEEKENSWRIDKAFKEKCRFDLEFFSSLLERILAEEELKRKKSKPRNSEGTKKKTSKHKGTRSDGRRVSRDHSSEEELDSDIVEGDSETAEKENEDCSNVVELGADTTATRSNLKRKTWEGEEIPREKSADGRNMQKNRPTCEEADENVLSEDHEGCVSEASDEDRLKRPESSIQGKGVPKIKPAQLSGGRLQRPTPNLTGRGSKKAPQARQKSGEEMDGDEDCSSKDVAEAGAPEGKRCRREMKHGDGVTSAEELEETDPPAMQEQKQNKPSRRIARIPQQQKQPGKEDSTSASSSQSKGVTTKGQGKQPTGPGKRAKPKPNLTAGQRNGRTGKSKLVTLRASQPEDNEEEEQDEAQPEEDFRYPINPEEQNQAPAFVPLSLRSPQPVSVEVVETMEELEISVNVPDVVGTAETEHALCSQPVCPGPQDEVVVPAEHQLDLLVDVIEFLSPENAAGSEESYNEAARTLLTIRNPELLSLAPPGYSTEIVIADESPHVELEESELSEKLTSEPADQLQCSSEDTQTVNSDLTITEASQSVSQPDPDRDSIDLIPAAESKSLPPVEASTFMATTEQCESVMAMESSQSVTAETQSVTILKPVDCKTCSVEESTVTEELHKQEIATLTSTGNTSDQALGPNTSAPQARRSRFPKPKPNLVHKVRTQRAAPPQSTEHSAAATVEPESLKTVEVEKEAMDCMLKEQVHDNLRNDGSDEEKAALQMETHAGNSQEGLSESDSSCQDVPPGGERHFAKTKPILDTGGQKPLVPLSLSTPAPDKGDDQRVLGDAEAQRPTEEENSASSENIASFEPNNKSQDNISTVDSRTEGQTKMNPLVEAEEVDGCCSAVTLTERCSADDGEKRHETSASTDTVLEQTSLHMEGDLSAAVSCQATEDHQSTFILTLFEVSPPMLSEYVSGEDPAGTVTAELLSPLVFVDEQSASLPMQTESADVMNEAAVEMEAEHGQVSHMKDGGPIEADSEEQGDGADHRSVRTEFSTDVTSHRMSSSVDSCAGLTLVPAEDSCPPQAGVECTRQQSAPPLQTRKMLVRMEGDGDQSVLRKEPDQTSPQSSSPLSSLPDPAVPNNCTGTPTRPDMPITHEPPQGIVGCLDHPNVEKESTAVADGTESGSEGKKNEINHQAMSVTSASPLTRTGRKPRGFLSFISDKSTSGTTGAPRPARPASQRPQVNTSRIERRRTPSVGSQPSKVTGTSGQSSSAKSAASEVPKPGQRESSSIKNVKTDGEPTSVSEYFFSDIFTQVEEPN